MDPKDLKRLAFSGLCTGVLAASCLTAAQASSPAKSDSSSLLKAMESAEGGNYGYHILTEDELMLELSPEGAKLYNSLTPEGKRLALLVASARCEGQNECKYLNGCKTATNECAGKSDKCKGTGKCAVATKDLAVKLVADKMARKRAEAAGVTGAKENPPKK